MDTLEKRTSPKVKLPNAALEKSISAGCLINRDLDPGLEKVAVVEVLQVLRCYIKSSKGFVGFERCYRGVTWCYKLCPPPNFFL